MNLGLWRPKIISHYGGMVVAEGPAQDGTEEAECNPVIELEQCSSGGTYLQDPGQSTVQPQEV